MSSQKLINLVILHFFVNANLMNSGTFVIRIYSTKRLQIRYCFTELPYHYRKFSDDECLKSGYLDVINQTETFLELRIFNITTAYLTVIFNITDRNEDVHEDQTKSLSYRISIDGALPTQRFAVTSGLIFDFSTICNRPFYGLMCAQYCTDEVDAHHVCDRSGNKVCLSGWTGNDCTIRTDKEVFNRSDSVKTTSTTQSSSSSSLSSSDNEPTVWTSTNHPTTFEPISDIFDPGSSHYEITSSSTVRRSTTRKPLGIATTSPNLSFEERLSTELTKLPVNMSNVSTYSTFLKVSTALLFVSLIFTVGLLMRNSSRSSWLQNLVNSGIARISMFENGFRRNEINEKVSRMFVVDLRTMDDKLSMFDNERVINRYSLPPTSKKYGERRYAANNSFMGSNTYHEIDSFLVSPIVEKQLATLV